MNKIVQSKKNLTNIRNYYVILLTFLLTLFWSNSQAETVEMLLQQKTVTLHFNKTPMQNVLAEIKKQSGVGFAIGEEIKNELGNVTLNVSNVTVEQALETLLTDTNYDYKIVNNQIVLKRKEMTNRDEEKSQVKSNEKKKVSGKVIDKSNGKAIAGATIIIANTNDGAISDSEGQFTLTAVLGNKINISYVGYLEQTLEIKGTDGIVVAMETDAMNVEDVVITGIFNKARESYTGAVTTVTAKDIKMFKGQNLLQTLKNIDPAFNVVMDNSFGSDPNRLPEVNIRGNSSLPMSVKELNENAQAQLNTPLVIMDGFEISLQKLMDFNDEEIESINIMKDAAATSIYGSRGANGVIVVTTKAPVAGKLKIFVQGGINIEIPDLSSYDLLNAREKLSLENSIGVYNSTTPSTDLKRQEKYAATLQNIIAGVDTDWLSQPIQTGVGQKYNLRFEGGSNEFKWGVSMGYNDVRGSMKGSDKKTFSGAITLSYSLKNIIFRNQSSITSNKGMNTPYGSFNTYAKMNPYWRIQDEDGEFIKSYSVYDNSTIGNPLYDATLNTKNSSEYLEFINNFSIDWTILQGLKLTAKFGISTNDDSSDNYKPASHSSFFNYGTADYFRKGNYQYTIGNQFNYDGNITINYSKVFAEKHNLYAGIDYSISQKDNYSYNIMVEGFPNDKFDFFSNANAFTKNKPSGSESQSRRIGFTGNVNYTFDNRYFADVSFRMDGSSQFGTNQKFAPFWSAGLGWNIHREKFIQDLDIITNLRIRGSYGETGSQQFSSYQALATYEYFNSDRYLFWSGAALKALGNPDLKWQNTKQYNFGLEVGLWGNRLSASVDYYKKETSNLLSQMNLQGMNGFSSYADNVGSIKNNGCELMLSGYIIRNNSNNVMWSVTGKIAHNKNIIGKLSDAIKKQNETYLASSNSNSNLLFEGNPVNSIYVVPSLGIDPSTGKEVFVSRFGTPTYTWDYRDRILMGVEEPKWRGTFSSMFSYKDFTLNVSFGYRFGGQQYNQTVIDKVENADMRYNVDRRVYEDRWQNVGDVTFFKGTNETGASRYSSRFVQDENTFEMQSLSLSYRLSSKWLQQTFRLNSLTIGCNTSDLFYFSSIKRERGTSYPFARRVSFNLSLLF